MSRQKPSINSIKIVMIGDSGVGKTSFLHRHLDGTYEENISTISPSFRTKIVELKDRTTQVKLELWDTAGRERYSTLAPMVYRNARGLILCFDLTDRQSFSRANTWLQQISKNSAPKARTILVGNKVDLADRRQVSTEEAKEFAQHAGISYFETSAKLNIGIEDAMKVLVNEIEDAGPLDEIRTESRTSDLAPVVTSRSWCNILLNLIQASKFTDDTCHSGQKDMEHTKLRVRQQFCIQIPLGSDVSSLEVVPLISETCFGIAVTSHYSPNCYQYRVKIMAKRRWGEEEFGTCFTWSKRNPISLEATTDFNGIALRLKINHGVFDFRTINELLIRIKIECFLDGTYLQQGSSSALQLLPKKRQNTAENHRLGEVTVPIQWIPETSQDQDSSLLTYSNSLYPLSDEHEGMQLVEINSRLNESYPDTLFNSDSNSSDLSSYENATNEQYMVLYNGNAEVIGNFRALNFYKASDINIKDDVQLLSDSKDPRGTLLKIDGVNYKFKKGISHTTNKRFVGYIAQQVESVVPEAVQLIDGILHVDYESLIPYLSESIRANFNDIKDTQAKTERIEKLVDQLYQQFLKQTQDNERSKRDLDAKDPVTVSTMEPLLNKATQKKWPKRLKVPAGCVILAIIALIMTGSIMAIVWLDSPLPQGSGPTVEEKPSVVPFDADLERTQRAILIELYTTMNGPNWRNNTGWLTDTSVCTWAGIECENGNGHVTKIFLVDNNLVGTLTPNLANLTELVTIDFTNNEINGTIPAELSRLRKLQVLVLEHNLFTGSVPEDFSQLHSLTTLQLGFNKLTKLLLRLDTMQNLTTLTAQNNLIRGPLPDMSGTQLVTVDLSSNNFEGPLNLIPASIETLVLSHNEINGTIENLFVQNEFKMLWINDNKFYGNISFTPHQWYTFQNLDLSYNYFTGFKEDNVSMHEGAVCYAADNNFACPLPTWTSRCSASCDSSVKICVEPSKEPGGWQYCPPSK